MSIRPGSRTLLQTFAWPAPVAAMTLAALVLGRVGGGVLDLIATTGLALPVAMSAILAMGGGSGGQRQSLSGTPDFVVWYEGEHDDPKLTLLRFDVEHAEVWNGAASRVAALKLLDIAPGTTTKTSSPTSAWPEPN